jgi:regulator of sirC expression with transglutaminase-like and TPR domain
MQQGRVLTHPVVARRRFEEIAARPDPLVDLVEASLVIALEENPAVDLEHHLAAVRSWSNAVSERSGGSRDAATVVSVLNRLLFEEEGFHGEAEDYYDPRSALVSEMLERHAGLPITLSVLYIEISRRAGLDAAGLALPGRFLVKITGPFGLIVVDPFEGGRVLSTVELQRILDSIYGGAVRLREDHLRSFSSVDRLLILDARDAWEVRDRAALAMQMHSYGQAIALFERYLDLMPAAEDRGVVRERVAWLRGWLDQN